MSELNSYICIRLCKLTVCNFISGVLCHKLNLWLFVQDPHIKWSTLNSSWTVTHREYCAFGSGELQYRCDQMGRTLLIHHSVISWSTGDILKWREQCFPELPVPRLPKNSEPGISMDPVYYIYQTSNQTVIYGDLSLLFPLSGSLLPPTSHSITSSSTMGRCNRSSAWWAHYPFLSKRPW